MASDSIERLIKLLGHGENKEKYAKHINTAKNYWMSFQSYIVALSNKPAQRLFYFIEWHTFVSHATF